MTDVKIGGISYGLISSVIVVKNEGKDARRYAT